MFQIIGFLGNVVMGVVDSTNKRDVDICKSNNSTRIELAKTLLEGAALIGSIALSAYYGCKSQKSCKTNPPLLKSNSHDSNFIIDSEEDSYVR